MTHGQCSWKDSSSEKKQYNISKQEKPSTIRNVLLVLNSHFETLQETTIHLLLDAKYGKRLRPNPNEVDSGDMYTTKAIMAFDDARLFTYRGDIWVSYREGRHFGFDKQVLNKLHFTTAGKFTVTAKASETKLLCCGRNMAMLDNVKTNRLQSVTWVDPLTVVDVLPSKQKEPSKMGGMDKKRRLLLENRTSLDQMKHHSDAMSTRRRQQQRKNASKKSMAKTNKSEFHGTNGMMVYLPRTEEYLGIGHFHRPPGRQANDYAHFGHHYTHAFFTIPATEPFYLKRLSAEFVLPSHAFPSDAEIIQFLGGLELVDEETIVITYGINDCEGAAVYVDRSKIETSLRKVPIGKEVVDLMHTLKSDSFL